MDSSLTDMTETTYNFIYDIWFSFARHLFGRVVEETGLDSQSAEALRKVALKPNDFIINVT